MNPKPGEFWRHRRLDHLVVIVQVDDRVHHQRFSAGRKLTMGTPLVLFLRNYRRER